MLVVYDIFLANTCAFFFDIAIKLILSEKVIFQVDLVLKKGV